METVQPREHGVISCLGLEDKTSRGPVTPPSNPGLRFISDNRKREFLMIVMQRELKFVGRAFGVFWCLGCDVHFKMPLHLRH